MDILPKKSENEVVLDELACINMAKQDPTKFKPLYEKYYEKIFRFIYSRIEDKKLAYDITADVFYKSLLKISTYQDQRTPFSSWLYRIARNELNNTVVNYAKHDREIERARKEDSHCLGDENDYRRYASNESYYKSVENDLCDQLPPSSVCEPETTSFLDIDTHC